MTLKNTVWSKSGVGVGVGVLNGITFKRAIQVSHCISDYSLVFLILDVSLKPVTVCFVPILLHEI